MAIRKWVRLTKKGSEENVTPRGREKTSTNRWKII